MKIVISSGHGKYIRGASGYLDEVDEARKVVETVAEFFQDMGVAVETFHDNTSTSQDQNLATICNYHNSQSRDYDISVHFNAYSTTSKPMGTEVWYYSQSSLASKVSAAMASAGAFINRGGKKSTGLYFLNNTEEPAILLEVCFVDSSADAELYRTHYESICRAIAESISGQQVPDQPPEIEEPPVEPPPELTDDNQVNVISTITGDVTVTVNGEMQHGHEGCEHRVDLTISRQGDVILIVNGQEFHNYPGETVPDVGDQFPANQTNIICTVFGGGSDPNNSAYAPYDTITDTELGVALPFKFPGERPQVRVVNRANRKEAICAIRDLGPWLTDDNYWDTTNRPLAETCHKNQTPLPRGPNKGEIPNGAGIDVTPGAAKAIGLDGKGNVDWQFVEGADVA